MSSTHDDMTTVILIRHGETDWNRERRFRGRAPVPLNARGRQEAELTAQRVAANWKINAIYSSPVVRAMETAEPLGRLTRLPIHLSEPFADLDYGLWQGRLPAEVVLSHPEELEAWLREPAAVRIPGGETLAEVEVRATSELAAIVSWHPAEAIAIVSHTEVNRLVILAALRGSPNALWHVGQDTCAINVLRVEDGAIDVLSLNDRCHLAALI